MQFDKANVKKYCSSIQALLNLFALLPRWAIIKPGDNAWKGRGPFKREKCVCCG